MPPSSRLRYDHWPRRGRRALGYVGRDETGVAAAVRGLTAADRDMSHTIATPASRCVRWMVETLSACCDCDGYIRQASGAAVFGGGLLDLQLRIARFSSWSPAPRLLEAHGGYARAFYATANFPSVSVPCHLCVWLSPSHAPQAARLRSFCPSAAGEPRNGNERAHGRMTALDAAAGAALRLLPLCNGRPDGSRPPKSHGTLCLRRLDALRGSACPVPKHGSSACVYPLVHNFSRFSRCRIDAPGACTGSRVSRARHAMRVSSRLSTNARASHMHGAFLRGCLPHLLL